MDRPTHQTVVRLSKTTTAIFGSALSKNISCGTWKQIVHQDSPPADTQALKVLTTALSEPRTLMVARWSKITSICVSKPVSTSKVSTLRSLQASGNSKYSQKVPRQLAIKFGPRVTCWSDWAKNTVWRSSGIRSHSGNWIGTVPVCTRTFLTQYSASAVTKRFMKRSAKRSSHVFPSTSPFTVLTTISV